VDTIASEACLDRIQEVLITDRLGQKLYGAALHRFTFIGTSACAVIKTIGSCRCAAVSSR
jgi:hypothetical protein